MDVPAQLAILECRSVSKFFEGVAAVDRIDLQLYPQEFLAILGPSGCGKSTLLRLIAGLETPDEGEIWMHHQKISSGANFLPAEKRETGLVFQDAALFPHLTVFDNIAFGLTGSRREKSERVDEMLELINLRDAGKKRPHELSGGEQQRVAIARALAPSPESLLLDEPFSNLDMRLRVELREEICSILRSENMSAILVTHDQEEAFSFADRLIVMRHGAIEQTGSPTEIYHYPKTDWLASFVGEANFLTLDQSLPLLHPSMDRNEILERFSAHPSRLMVRPEDCSVQRGAESGRESHGRIQACEFRGNQQFLTIHLTSGAILRVVVHSRSSWRVHDPVLVQIHQVTLCEKRHD